MKMYPDRIAYHEAGHAIIGIVHGLTVESISIKANDPRGCLGLVRYVDNMAFRSLEPWKRMSCSIAGTVSELGYDNRYMKELSMNDLNGTLDQAISDKAVVHSMIESFPKQNRERIVDDIVKFTGSRLARNWTHVISVAELVEQKGELDFDQFQNWFDKRMKYETFYY